MSNYSRPNNQHIAALKGYAAEVLRQYEEKETDLQKAEKTLNEIKEMQRIYPEDEELLGLFASQSLVVDRLLLEVHELEVELDEAKNSLKGSINNRHQHSADLAMQTVEAHMNAVGLEVPRVSAIAKQMEEDARRQKLEALKAARHQNVHAENEDASDDVEAEDEETIENPMSEHPVERKPL